MHKLVTISEGYVLYSVVSGRHFTNNRAASAIQGRMRLKSLQRARTCFARVCLKTLH